MKESPVVHHKGEWCIQEGQERGFSARETTEAKSLKMEQDSAHSKNIKEVCVPARVSMTIGGRWRRKADRHQALGVWLKKKKITDFNVNATGSNWGIWSYAEAWAGCDRSFPLSVVCRADGRHGDASREIRWTAVWTSFHQIEKTSFNPN